MFSKTFSAIDKIKHDIEKAVRIIVAAIFFIVLSCKIYSLYTAITELSYLRIISNSVLLLVFLSYFAVWLFNIKKNDKKSKKIQRTVKKLYTKTKRYDKLLKLLTIILISIANFLSENSFAIALTILIFMALGLAIKIAGVYINTQINVLTEALKEDFANPFIAAGHKVKNAFAKIKYKNENSILFDDSDLEEFDRSKINDDDKDFDNQQILV